MLDKCSASELHLQHAGFFFFFFCHLDFFILFLNTVQ